MSYINASATKLLATNCVCCGLPLVDSKSVELGIGPDCRKKAGVPSDIDNTIRLQANKLVYEAALAAQNGAVEKVLELSEEIANLGLDVLADKVARRFKKGALKASVKADIEITEDGDFLVIKTPYRRKGSEEFIDAWRNIPGRKYDFKTKRNTVPKSQKEAVWDLLIKFFPNKWGKGPKGTFKVPARTEVEQVEEKDVQLELELS